MTKIQGDEQGREAGQKNAEEHRQVEERRVVEAGPEDRKGAEAQGRVATPRGGAGALALRKYIS